MSLVHATSRSTWPTYRAHALLRARPLEGRPNSPITAALRLRSRPGPLGPAAPHTLRAAWAACWNDPSAWSHEHKTAERGFSIPYDDVTQVALPSRSPTPWAPTSSPPARRPIDGQVVRGALVGGTTAGGDGSVRAHASPSGGPAPRHGRPRAQRPSSDTATRVVGVAGPANERDVHKLARSVVADAGAVDADQAEVRVDRPADALHVARIGLASASCAPVGCTAPFYTLDSPQGVPPAVHQTLLRRLRSTLRATSATWKRPAHGGSPLARGCLTLLPKGRISAQALTGASPSRASSLAAAVQGLLQRDHSPPPNSHHAIWQGRRLLGLPRRGGK